jgi:flagellar biosynthesis/type III secretory pathway protein FliH
MDSERYDGAGAAGHYAAMLNAAYSKGYGKGQQAVLLLLAPMAQAWKSVQSELDEIAKQVGQC